MQGVRGKVNFSLQQGIREFKVGWKDEQQKSFADKKGKKERLKV